MPVDIAFVTSGDTLTSVGYEATFLTPLQRLSAGGWGRGDETSMLFVRTLAQGMSGVAGRHKVEFRACYLQQGTVESVARAFMEAQTGIDVLVTGYSSYYTLAIRSGGGWASSLEDRNQRTIPGSRVGGTRAPRPELAAVTGGGG